MNDRDDGYAYPPPVRFEITQDEISSYHRAADFLNIKNVDVVCLQHEYGIYGGSAGSHILGLIKSLRMPIVATLHTVLKEPDPHQRRVLIELCGLCSRVVVMAERGKEYLTEIYGIPEEKIDFIHHGIPDVPFVDPNFHKDSFGVEGKIVMLTFGLLSPNKGIEYAIEALPRIIQKYPDIVYIVLGATHPHLLKSDGELYRLSLQRLAKKLGVEENVIFHNRFVSIEELIDYICSADLYLTPYLNRAQLVSGTLAYSVGAGKAVVSTPLWYAEEILGGGRGMLVPEKDSEAIAEKVIELLDHEVERHAMRKRAYMFGRTMIWSEVADRYLESFERAREEARKSPHYSIAQRPFRRVPDELPGLNLDHLFRMTDDTSIFQHAVYTVPDHRHGYCSDDTARALILAILLENEGGRIGKKGSQLAPRYLSFLHYAWNPDLKRFRNFMGYHREWLEEEGSVDSQGRVVWALGTVIGRSQRPGLRALSNELFEQILPETRGFEFLRSKAFTLLGIQEFLRRFYGHRLAQQIRVELAEDLLNALQSNRKPDWVWFEDELTYDNAKLPHALILAGRWIDREDMVRAGIEALSWLCDIQTGQEGQFVPIGSEGFYRRGGERARFDQQPIEAHSTLSACLEAHLITGDPRWMREATRAFEWFLGMNDLARALYDPSTGGCCDGLERDSVNQNQGAESTLAYLLSLVEMILSQHLIKQHEENGRAASAEPSLSLS
jgi:glycosyltransferase involved in cell wall biosynthesis